MRPAEEVDTASLLKENLGRLERRDWWCWFTAFFIMLLLSLAVYSFTLQHSQSRYTWLDSEQVAVRALFAFVVVFSVFTVHRQLLINRLRRQLSTQSSLTAALQTRAELFQKLAILDPLTGLYNRRFAMQQLASETARATRHKYKLSVVLFDLNGLKLVNDRYGHAAGDLLLREFASALRRAVRSSDVAVRLGGDEFLVILPECDSGDLPRILGRIGQRIVEYEGNKIELHFAAGQAEYIRGESVEELLDRADRRVYEDKRSGNAEQQGAAAREMGKQTAKLTTMGRLTASVAHDFNNLLTVIKGYTELILDRVDVCSSLRAQVEEIRNASERAASMTEQLLAFSRKHAVEPTIVNLNKLVADTEMMLGRLVGKSITITFEPAADLHDVCIDNGQFGQILMNLAANARDAMPHGGTLLIKTRNSEIDPEYCALHRGARQGSYACLVVRDNGMGMGPEVKSRVFEPFFTTKEAGKGTGLGLSTVYGIVKQNGGYIWVDAEPLEGTCVSIYLPRAVVASKVEAAPVLTEQKDSKERTMIKGAATVLVVENFDSLRRLICDFLRNEGYNVIETGSAEEAVQIAAESADSIELLVIDAILPGMSGLEVADSIRRLRSGLKVLYVSGYIEDAILIGGGLQEDAQFLTAPFTAKEFVRKLRQLHAPGHQEALKG